MPSSRVTVVVPSVGTAVIWASKAPASRAAAARSCDSAENASSRSRAKPRFCAIFSAETPWLKEKSW